MQEINIEITESISKNQRIRAIEIFYDAFERKIRALIKSKEKAISIYSNSLKNDHVFYALLNGNIVGLIGLHYKNKTFLDLKYGDIRKYFNPLRSYFIYRICKLASPKIKDDVLRIDSIAVDKSIRSQGIGTLLINKVFEFAKNEGFKEVILEVVNTNPKAKALYERIGFREKKIVRYYFLTRSAGFSSEYVMSYKL
ncbi:MAG: GNAT family N-acetyltransferase [Actinobacteria bacterium]|nr:GNAT family N-acetyltransferase [Actinomycetota bacterium]